MSRQGWIRIYTEGHDIIHMKKLRTFLRTKKVSDLCSSPACDLLLIEIQILTEYYMNLYNYNMNILFFYKMLTFLHFVSCVGCKQI